MRDAAIEAIKFSKGHSRADLDTTRILVLALVKSVEIIGEAAYQVSKQTKEQYQEILGRISLTCDIV